MGLPMWLSDKESNLPAKQEMLVQPLGEEDPHKKEMATHSSILAWRSHGQRSLVGYSPWVCRVRHDLATETATISLMTFENQWANASMAKEELASLLFITKNSNKWPWGKSYTQ